MHGHPEQASASHRRAQGGPVLAEGSEHESEEAAHAPARGADSTAIVPAAAEHADTSVHQPRPDEHREEAPPAQAETPEGGPLADSRVADFLSASFTLR